MANRIEGTFPFSFSFEVGKQQPLDARLTVPEKAGLTALPYAYIGMIVAVTSDPTPANNGIYLLEDDSSFFPGQTLTNWVKQSCDDTYLTGVTVNSSDKTAIDLSFNNNTSFQVDLSEDHTDGITGHQFILIETGDMPTFTYELDFTSNLSRTENTIVCNLEAANDNVHYFIDLPQNGTIAEAGCRVKIILKNFQETDDTFKFFVRSQNGGSTTQNQILATNLETYTATASYLPLEIMEILDLVWDGNDWIVTNYIKQDYVSVLVESVTP